MKRGLASVVLTACAIVAAAFAACIPPELVGSSGAGAGHTGGAGMGAGLTGGSGISGGNPGGGTGGAPALCEDAVCQTAGGVCAGGACLIACDAPLACENVTCPPNMPCRVECNGDGSCFGTVKCDQSTSCEVVCKGPKSCGDAANTGAATVVCPDSPAGCQVLCEDGTSCGNLSIDAIGASVSLVCEAQLSCATVACAGGCEALCGGPGACASLKCTDGPCTLTCAAEQTCGVVTCAGAACAIHCTGAASCADPRCKFACSCDVDCAADACAGAAVCPQDDMNSMGICSDGNGCSSILDPSCVNCP